MLPHYMKNNACVISVYLVTVPEPVGGPEVKFNRTGPLGVVYDDAGVAEIRPLVVVK
jgi:hypothetical protein